MTRKRKQGICNCIALYDWTPERSDLKSWFQYMEQWGNELGMAWESIGLGFSQRLMQFKNGKRKAEKLNFESLPHILLLGGVIEPGTNDDWKISAAFSAKKSSCRNVTELCFDDVLAPFQTDVVKKFLKNLLQFADFKYGICYQRDFNCGPDEYAYGSISTYGDFDLSDYEEDRIGRWMHEYTFHDGSYGTGLLRDVYPFNIFVDTHLSQKVGNGTLQRWIESDPAHGTLEKITEHHWLWSIDPQHIPVAQEVLQEASLLLCYKV